MATITQICYRSAQGLQGSSTTGGHGLILLDGLRCTGSETSLATCPRAVEIGWHGCSHSEDARAVCHFSNYLLKSENANNVTSGILIYGCLKSLNRLKS